MLQVPELSREGTIAAFRRLLFNETMMKNVDYWLSCVMNALSQGQSTFRSKAIKALATVVEADASMMNDERLTNAIRSRFLDEAISVREAAVDFAGRLVLYSPDTSAVLPYLEMILERIRDKGFSVRRRVISILRSVLVSSPNHSYRIKISVALLQRVTDPMEEEEITKMILDSFQSLWFDVPVRLLE